MGRLQDKVALVTGGGGGLGREIVKALWAEGARVMVTDIQDDAGRQLVAELGERVDFAHHDVASEKDWAAVMETVKRRFGALDVLVNNAAVLMPGTVEDATLEQFRRIMQINAESCFLGSKYAVAAMQARGGSIINIASLASWLPNDSYLGYSASKAAVAAMTRGVALHCRKKGWPIRVNSVHPDAICTPMMQAGLPPDIPLSALLWDPQSNPQGRAYRPEQVARVVLLLATDDAALISGAEVRVDNAVLGLGML